MFLTLAKNFRMEPVSLDTIVPQEAVGKTTVWVEQATAGQWAKILAVNIVNLRRKIATEREEDGATNREAGVQGLPCAGVYSGVGRNKVVLRRFQHSSFPRWSAHRYTQVQPSQKSCHTGMDAGIQAMDG